MIPIPIPSTSAEDGSPIGYRYFPAAEQNAPLVGVIHGSSWWGEARAQPVAVGIRRALDDDSADTFVDAFGRDSLSL